MQLEHNLKVFYSVAKTIMRLDDDRSGCLPINKITKKHDNSRCLVE